MKHFLLSHISDNRIPSHLSFRAPTDLLDRLERQDREEGWVCPESEGREVRTDCPVPRYGLLPIFSSRPSFSSVHHNKVVVSVILTVNWSNSSVRVHLENQELPVLRGPTVLQAGSVCPEPRGQEVIPVLRFVQSFFFSSVFFW